MERRKFVIGAGALATGSAAALGTGAFSSVEADRSVTIDVADDADALLRLEAPESLDNSAYADTSDGALTIDITENTDTEGGSPDGVNPNAFTNILDVFTIENQGTQEVEISVDGYDPDDPFDIFATDVPGEDGDFSTSLVDDTALPKLPAGESLNAGLFLDATDDEFEDLVGDLNVTINAEAV